MERKSRRIFRVALMLAAAIAASSKLSGRSSTIAIVTHSVAPPVSKATFGKTVLYRVGVRNHADYAAANGYLHLNASACNASALLSTITPPAWGKIFLVRECMQAFPHLRLLVWADADAFFPNSTIRLEERLGAHGANLLANASCSLFFAEDKRVRQSLTSNFSRASLRKARPHPLLLMVLLS